MLACSQDIFFHNDSNTTGVNNKYQHLIHESMQTNTHKDKRIRHQQHLKDQLMNNDDIEMTLTSNSDDLLDNSVVANNMKDKEEVLLIFTLENHF